MLEAARPAFAVDEAAASHHDMPTALGVYLTGHPLQGSGEQRIVGVQESPNLAGGKPEPLVDGVGVPAVRFGHELHVSVWS
jgi:hypothetical protein